MKLSSTYPPLSSPASLPEPTPLSTTTTSKNNLIQFEQEQQTESQFNRDNQSSTSSNKFKRIIDLKPSRTIKSNLKSHSLSKKFLPYQNMTTTSELDPKLVTVTKSSNRKGPHLITCLRTDAMLSKLRDVGPIIDSTGAECYWKTNDPETRALEVKWKKSVGKSLARLLKLTEEKSDEDWQLTKFPENYKLYRYVKGEREDTYLLGCEHVAKFRTANEFSPHLYWLCTDADIKLDRSRCRCKYCSGSKQSHVNSALGFSEKPDSTTSSSTIAKITSHNKRKAEEDIVKESTRRRTISDTAQLRATRSANSSNKPTARKSLPATSSSGQGATFKKSVFNGPYVNKDRDRDLAELQCAFRQAELIWCQLDKPIEGTKEGQPDVRIEYWPAVCEERVLESVPEVLVDEKVKAGEGSGVRMTRYTMSSATNSTSPIDQNVRLKVTQRYFWKVRLLGTSDVLLKPESDLLAYLNYPTPSNLFKIQINPSSLTHIYNGHETGRPSIKNFETVSDAITAFALSLQMSVHIKNRWSLMDRYDIPFLRQIQDKGNRNALQAEERQILYEDSNLPWFQYLWWGAEKIWSGELIRLIVQAKDLPHGLRPISPGSDHRCFFLKITGIYRSDQEKGMIKGPIFELAHVDQLKFDKMDLNPDFDQSGITPSHQANVNRYMPQPPPDYYFRRLTPIGKEHHLVLQHVAGRYYPPHQLSIPPTLGQINGIVNNDPNEQSATRRSLSLCGLDEGKWLHMHCSLWVQDRKECFRAAETSAEQDLISWKDKPFNEFDGEVEEQRQPPQKGTVQSSAIKEEFVIKEQNGALQSSASKGESVINDQEDTIPVNQSQPTLVEMTEETNKSMSVLSTDPELNLTFNLEPEPVPALAPTLEPRPADLTNRPEPSDPMPVDQTGGGGALGGEDLDSTAVEALFEEVFDITMGDV
ncbi:hypothetical protein CROQUDRAFT_654686 [Cronartium quercuum f. sp. fusiforme G11]|uniref:Cryptic loci regulator 2 N-terminal domain-containing protein n=1 Tax=Cronartium quercuum f. sp. fusiforme G11 TaxID=708437 RepID=A0A9P6TE89_9BASI|nr:hypothetical protein CROQUDRAFT_654686 [Cronartium quercuum f. sp. fusiforme G11]